MWFGTLDGVRNGVATFVTTDGVIAGTVFTDDGVFEIRYAGNGIHEIRQLDPMAFPSDDPAFDVVPADGLLSSERVASSDTAAQIDVLVAWTPAARVGAGGSSAIRSTIELAIENTNIAYGNSGALPRLRLVYAGEIAFNETDIYTDLTRFAGTGDGFADAIHVLRDQHGADLVSLVGAGYTNEGACGIGYLMSNATTAFASTAFNIVDWSCAAGNLSLAHELGHNQGLHHDPAHASGQASFSYAYGYQDPAGNFRTVMAYACGYGAGCPRKPLFSTPAVLYNGARTGTPMQDNVRALNSTAQYVANFRPAVLPACTYSTAVTSTSFGSAGGTGAITVTTAPGCGWTARSDAAWITISTTAQSGSRSIAFSVAPNGSKASRTGTLTVSGNRVTISQAPELPAPGPSSLTAAKADFNGDSRPDLVWQHNDGHVAFWLMDGSTLGGTAVIDATADAGWQIVGSGDLDGDGRPEIVWQHQGGWLAAWFLHGTELHQSTYLNVGAVTADWKIVAVADLNQDNKADLVCQNDAGQLAVWHMNGVNKIDDEYFTPNQADSGWTVAGAGDMNGDGYTDLVWQHDGGHVAVWLMNGSTLMSALFVTPDHVADTNWKIRAVVDLNGDGHTDLIWRHATEGWIAAWLMDGTEASSTPFLYADLVAAEWQLVGPR